MPRPDLHVAVYGDVDLNLIDGSAIWAQATVETFSAAGCQVQLLLKAPVRTARLTDHVARLPGATLVRPFEDRMVASAPPLTRVQAADLLERLDDATRFDVVVLRGFGLVREVAARTRFRGRMWTYLTDVPQRLGDLDLESREQLGTVAAASQLMLCQTEELRGFLEATVPAACGKCVLLPPVVPPAPAFRDPARPPEPDAVRLVYTGKYAPRWNTLPMTALPAQLSIRGVRATLHMVGDKVHRDPADPGFHDRMRTALRSAPGVVWHGGVPRREAMTVAAEADIGLGWRDAALDGSLELSTKVLEFGAVGLPVVLNRTRVHEDLLGVDYPLFANDLDAVLAAVERAVADPATWRSAADRCRRAAQDFALDRAVARVESYLDRTHPRRTGRPARRVVVAGHDLKFFSRLLDHLRSLPDVEVRVDQWSSLAEHDERASQRLLEWADVVICEWCGPNAVWYSRRKRPGQRLIVRLHRFELEAGYGERVAIDAVDRVVCVSPSYRDLTLRTLGWPADKVLTVPNWVDVAQFDRPKYPGARFHLGMIGIVPARKRLDLGLDVLERLRGHDERYMLFVKSKLPWEHWWVWQRPAEQRHYTAVFRRLQTSPALRGAVVFDGHGDDVAAWLRTIGFVLSTSDDESFHLSPAEGMASGAVPVVRPWPGAATIYDREWIHDGADAMAAAILRRSAPDAWDEARGRARRQVGASYGLERVAGQWTRLVHGDEAVADGPTATGQVRAQS